MAATVRTESSIVDSTLVDKGRLDYLGKGEALCFRARSFRDRTDNVSDDRAGIQLPLPA